MNKLKKTIFHLVLLIFLMLQSSPIFAQQDQGHVDQDGVHHAADHEGDLCAHAGHHDGPFEPAPTAFHHISDLNVFNIGPWNFALPCILYAPDKGWDLFMSNKFGFERRGHGDGQLTYKGYVLDEGLVKRVRDSHFPGGSVEVGGFAHEGDDSYVCYQGKPYALDSKSTMDAGLFGGGITSFYDFSLTKNVISMFLVGLFLLWIFLQIARAYKDREGLAPQGVQSFMEPIFLFIQDEVAKPFLGKHWAKFLPFLMALFFFILGLNLFGQIPFLGGANVTGNLAVTMSLALFAFVVTNINGNKHYWEHVFWMPGVPAAVKAVIITPVEFLGLFIKPFTLMLRLFANITAGHMVVLSFIGLIFIFGNSGDSFGGASLGAVVSVPLTMFMMAIELLVAFIQAFVFTILTASYIGAATEEHH
ncbi:MAG: F0F1 ATP synthase subunit A [Saprospiraceae bacterium]|nr:F0F1 ATP synthase subunit A [Saprospiraceae bacterium]